MSGLFAPTAATEAVLWEPVKLPTIAISEALNNCSNIPVAATGSAYCGILFQILPFNISNLGRFSVLLIKSSSFSLSFSLIIYYKTQYTA